MVFDVCLYLLIGDEKILKEHWQLKKNKEHDAWLVFFSASKSPENLPQIWFIHSFFFMIFYLLYFVRKREPKITCVCFLVQS